MKHCFIVTSSIQVDNKHIFKGTANRSCFSTETRLQQTIGTLLNLKLADPQADIVLVDSSPERFEDIDKIGGISYVEVSKINSYLCHGLNTHSSKSFCESQMLLFVFYFLRKELAQYDFITKISGRYLVDNSFHLSLLNKENTDKFIFKKNRDMIHPVENLYPDFRRILPPEIIKNGIVSGLWTSIYSVGKEKINFWEMLLKIISNDCTGKYYNIDIEYIMYYYFDKFNMLDKIVFSDSKIYGWQGNSGVFQKY